MRLAHFFSRITAFINSTSWVCAVIAAVCLVIMVLATMSDIFMRYFFNDTITGVMEFDSTLLVFAVFLGIAYTQHLRAHIRVEIFTSRLRQRTQQVVDLVMLFLSLGVFSLVVWGTIGQAVLSWGILELQAGAARFPVYPAKTVMPIGAFVYCLVVVTQIVQRIGELRGHAPVAGAPGYPEAPAIG